MAGLPRDALHHSALAVRRAPGAQAHAGTEHALRGGCAATAYAGRYEIDAGKGTITHIPAVSLDPADTGQRLIRQFKLVDGRLLLSGKWKYQGEELTFTVHWLRATVAKR